MPLQLRRLLIVLTLFGSLLLTAVIAIFLVFKVDAVELTGDQLYSEADVMQACNYHIGDNLFFLSTTDKEQLLPEKLPYVGKAKITRKIPGTIVIQLTAAKPACQFENGGQYVLVDETGKVMDMKAEATAGVMLVTGTEPGNQRYGKPFVLADAEKLSAYQQILAKLIAENAVADVTGLDFTDVHNISMVYQDRITMKLGGVADLDYKLRFGLSTVRDNISSVKKGTLDLSLAPETGKAPFSENLSQNQGTEESAQNNGGETQEKTYSFASNPGRGRDIPDKPYTGGSDAGDAAAGTTAVPEDAADTDNAENGGDGSSYSENTDDSAGTGDTENTQGNGSGENAENTPQAENGEGAE